MKLFIDSANIGEIREAVSWGIIDGVTTNPSLMAKEKGLAMEKIAKEICKMVKGPVSLEGGAMEHEAMLREGRAFSSLAKNAVFKIPMTIDGVRTVKKLSAEGIKTNVTLVFSANQALLAAKAGATFVSPFIGRLDDIGRSGIDLIREIVLIFRAHDLKTKVLAASIRDTDHVKQSALVGADMATVPFQILRKMFDHELTDKGIAIFQKAWKEKNQ
ncbi:fructose-6-phosphate aldolase [Patescibacteria group bacterium]|nr:fructose-6-phosphate aldolase [Patescibacteria group bacterium]